MLTLLPGGYLAYVIPATVPFILSARPNGNYRSRIGSTVVNTASWGTRLFCEIHDLG